MEGKGIGNLDAGQKERDELRAHLEYLGTMEDLDPEERLLAIERYRRARELVTRFAPAGTDDRRQVVQLLDAVAERLGIEKE